MEQIDDTPYQRRAEKDDALAASASVLPALEHEHRNPDRWERVHLVRAFAAIFSGSYLSAIQEARLAEVSPGERSPKAMLPHDPIFDRADFSLLTRVWHEAKAEPVRAFPHFSRVIVK